jgi:hypothetical protein
MTKRRPHRHERQRHGHQFGNRPDSARWATNAGRTADTANDLPEPVSATGDPHQGVGTLAGADASQPGDVGIGGDDMFGENSAAQGTGDTGKINVHGSGTDQAGFGTSAGGASDPVGGATMGVGSTFGTTDQGTEASRGAKVERNSG